MNGFYLINDQRVMESLDLLSVIKKVETVYSLKAKGETTLFPIITHDWEVGTKDMDIKSGCIGGDINIYGLKILTYMEKNDALDLPRLSGTMMIFDTNNGQLKGILDSRSITGLRTGAAGAIGSKYLARKGSETILLVGAGNQAFYNLAANLLVMDNIKNVLVYDPIDKNHADKFVSSAKERLNSLYSNYKSSDYEAVKNRLDLKFKAVENIEEAVKSSDIIVTVTPSRKPLIKKEWVKEGTHFNCIGADMEGKQEIDGQIFANAKVVVDDIIQATNYGETEIPVKSGIITEDEIHGEIGSLINNDIPSRTSNDEITIFDTTGLALQDLIVANLLIELADKDNLKKYML
jgi:ornithine cyclodeaminase/alanine dehydrogenase